MVKLVYTGDLKSPAHSGLRVRVPSEVLNKEDMITTWGIFWISFFGAIVLNTLIKRVLPPKYPKVDMDTQEKLRELVQVFASNLVISEINNEGISERRAKRRRKKKL